MLYRFEDVWKRFGPKEVLRGSTWQHNPGEKVGLVGKNGAGKTTLFKILLGEEEPDKGKVHRTSGLTIGVLRQHLEKDVDGSVFDYAEGAFADVLRMEVEMRDLEHRMAEPGDDLDAVMDRYGKLQKQFELADGYALHAKVEKVLVGVGLTKEFWEKPVAKLSGGEKHRVMLSRLLLQAPDLLLLDEPTNHLDLAGIEFLEEFLLAYEKGYVVISHDRHFLNRCCDKILDLEFGELTEYPGAYEVYREMKAERMALAMKAYREQQEMIEKTKDFIRKNIAGQKTKQAKSRRKMLDKIDVIERPMEDRTEISFKLEAKKVGGGTALTFEDVDVGLDDSRVFLKDLDFQLRRATRLGLVGPNGCGKSTLLRAISGRRPQLHGRIALGYQVSVGYYDQEMRDLTPGKRVVDEMWDLDHRRTEGEVRDLLAQYDFRGDEVFREVATLSGGEKGRLSLAKVVFGGDHLLLLDEPTNHLDLDAREALESALEDFDGTIVTVSHDRWYLDRICDEILLFVGNGRWERMEGGYSDNLERIRPVLEGLELPPAAPPRSAPAKTPEPPKEEKKPEPKKTDPKAEKLSAEEKKKQAVERKKRQERITQLESRIAARESIVKETETKLCDPAVFSDGAKVKTLQEQLAWTKTDLEKLYEEWTALTED